MTRLTRSAERTIRPGCAERGPFRQLDQNIDVHAPLAGFVSRDHALRDLRKLAQFLLGEAALLTPFSQIHSCVGHSGNLASDAFPDGKGRAA